MAKIPEPLPGYSRQWVRCRDCGQVAYYDYIPFSLGNPVMTLPCGHGAAQKFYEAAEDITPEQAREELKIQYFATPGPYGYGPGWYFADETVTENMEVTRHIGPYPDRETAVMALSRFELAVKSLRQVFPGERGLYIHLMEKENE